MTKFEKSMVLLAALFMLGLFLVNRTAGTPVPLQQTAVPERSCGHNAEARLDINTATAEELCALPGVGAVIAERIIERRPFDSTEDLLAVEGIGEATLEKIYEYLEGN